MATTVFGNLTITKNEKGRAVEIGLNSYQKGQPHAVFTYAEIATLAQILRGVTPAPASAAPVDDDDWSDLI